MRFLIITTLALLLCAPPLQAGSVSENMLLRACINYDTAVTNTQKLFPDATMSDLTSENVAAIVNEYHFVRSLLTSLDGQYYRVVIGHFFELEGVETAYVMLAGPDRDGGMCLRTRGELPVNELLKVIGQAQS